MKILNRFAWSKQSTGRPHAKLPLSLKTFYNFLAKCACHSDFFLDFTNVIEKKCQKPSWTEGIVHSLFLSLPWLVSEGNKVSSISVYSWEIQLVYLLLFTSWTLFVKLLFFINEASYTTKISSPQPVSHIWANPKHLLSWMPKHLVFTCKQNTMEKGLKLLLESNFPIIICTRSKVLIFFKLIWYFY